jgi:hypothetical protein
MLILKYTYLRNKTKCLKKQSVLKGPSYYSYCCSNTFVNTPIYCNNVLMADSLSHEATAIGRHNQKNKMQF